MRRAALAGGRGAVAWTALRGRLPPALAAGGFAPAGGGGGTLVARRAPSAVAASWAARDRRGFASGDGPAQQDAQSGAGGGGATSSASDSTGPAKREPVDIRTALDEQRALRHVERRIEEHTSQQAALPPPPSSSSDARALPASEATSEAVARQAEAAPGDAGNNVAPGEAPSASRVPAVQAALRINDPNSSSLGAGGGKDIVVRSRTTTGQVLWPATPEDIEILSDSKLLYPAPYEVEGSVIIRLVRLSDPVTSPVARVVRNRQFGIRGNEKWQLLAMGAATCLFIYGLGFWQLRRMEWKRDLLETRRTRLAMPRLTVTSSPFPWREKVQDYTYRVVDVRGVFDHRREMFVGPRPGVVENGETVSGCLVVTPLTLEDGSKILVNRGHLPANRLDRETRPEVPCWVRVRGVLEEGEIPTTVGEYARLKNRPDRNQFVYLIAEDLAENSGARNHSECAEALVTAFDVLYEDDFKAGMRREMPFSMRHKEDYLLFWADEHTHFNYAMQWFGMGTLIMTMTVYKFIEVMRWRF
eukprot:TRINITY_DN54484_c0_g1_i1.p1 TRINITY_DN54484_c0_g1~~TRINITY_DN54484_c0_g1_i1.p1  ORF type:complete len:530 (+),score=99.70 TRINITY_DN54484_c0_g1_i1:68-1657(+)